MQTTFGLWRETKQTDTLLFREENCKFPVDVLCLHLDAANRKFILNYITHTQAPGQNLVVVVAVNCLLAVMLKSCADVMGAICIIFYMDNSKNCSTR